jgi:hypothetical protein
VKDKKLNQSTFTPLSHVKIEIGKVAGAKRDLIVINKIDFAVKNLTSDAGLFLLLENAKTNGVFELIDHDLVFENTSTNKIKMNWKSFSAWTVVISMTILLKRKNYWDANI